MSSADFVRILNEVGYPKASKFNPSDWDWMFELGGGAGAFLQWLCRSVSASNVLTDAERTAYSRVKESEGVLEGARLDEALAALEEEETDLQLEVQQLTADLDSQRARLEKLSRLRDQLCNENLSLSMELSQLTESQTAARATRHRLRQRLAADELALNDGRARLATAARRLTGQLTESRGALLGQTPLDGVEATEQRVSERLAELARRAFSSAQRGGAEPDCSLLDLRPARLGGEAAHRRLAAQLTRLERLLPAAKRGAQAAAAETAGLRDAIQLAERLCSDPAQRAAVATRPVPAAPSADRDAQLRQALAAAAEKYVQGILARACVGDHALKVERQEAALERQAEARAAAVQQLARLEWLRRAVAAESGTVSAAGDTLAEAGQQADERARQVEHRLRLMERTAHQAAQSADPDGPAAELRSALALPDTASPSESEQLRAGLRQQLSSQRRQLRTAGRLQAALERSTVAARTGRLEQTVCGVQPELKAVLRQWEERRGARPPQDTLWMLMLTAPARLETTVLEAERAAAGEQGVRAAAAAAAAGN
ncbi:HAUS augmin-like complex subunit 3 [Amphibalanus amphitrite]|uniref:HAUS augmin-like complex subunit 3 n=1 Tax=Amphibalanus amphitrite TaxID=1232801 RepID=UPI001C8FB911|nr:HAUS augmin-like complex subunit 3 [Amphibalanus amphitrite]XP_043206955.1 HAUS augmin-like complex subunit 3 [Amphibalanus amphitrite]XP_043206956.1 HAUS augmin-like complex subunit 3 [Amphibalanus amphitrite]